MLGRASHRQMSKHARSRRERARHHRAARRRHRRRTRRPGRRRPPHRARPRAPGPGSRPDGRRRGARVVARAAVLHLGRARRPGRREAPRPHRLDPARRRPPTPPAATGPSRYLQPLADVLGDRVRYGATVTGVSRAGRDRIVDADREQQPFVVHITHADGREERVFARAVIDASGTWTTPSPAGGRRPARPRREGRRRPHHLPRPGPQGPGRPRPVRGQAHRRHRLRRLRLHRARLPRRPRQADEARARTRCGSCAAASPARTFGGGEADQLPARGALGLRGEGRRRRRPRRRGHRLPHRGHRAGRRRPPGPGRRGRPPPGPGRRGHRPDRLPPRPVLPLRAAPRPRRAPPGPDRAGPADRPQPALLRHRLPARHQRARPTRSRASTWSA